MRTSDTLLAKPLTIEASNDVVSAAAGILASFVTNNSQATTSSNSSQVNFTNNQIQQMLKTTLAAVYNSAKQLFVGDQPMTFTTTFSRLIAARTTLNSLNGTISYPGMATVSLAPNLAALILGSESRGFTQPLSVIAESYNSSVRWANNNKTFVSGVHGVSFFGDSGPILVSNLSSASSLTSAYRLIQTCWRCRVLPLPVSGAITGIRSPSIGNKMAAE